MDFTIVKYILTLNSNFLKKANEEKKNSSPTLCFFLSPLHQHFAHLLTHQTKAGRFQQPVLCFLARSTEPSPSPLLLLSSAIAALPPLPCSQQHLHTSLASKHCSHPACDRCGKMTQDVSNPHPIHDHSMGCVGLVKLSQGKKTLYFSPQKTAEMTRI